MLAATASQRDALLHEAQSLRASGRVPEALLALARLRALHPRFSRLYQERGHCLVLLRDGPAAIEALREAVQLNPTLPASWDMLEQLYRMLGDTAQAAAAAQHLAILQQLPSEVVVANSLCADGDLAEAEEVLRGYLRKDSGNVGALRLLARIRQDREAPEDAQSLLEAVLDLAPDYHEARFDYAAVLLGQQKHWQAHEQSAQLVHQDSGNREYLRQYAAACVGLGDHEPVIDLCEKLLAGAPRSGSEAADLYLWRANALKTVGRQPEAIAGYRAALAARRDYGVAWFSLANLKTYRFTAEEIAHMQAAEARPETQDMDRVYLCFALGKALEDQGDYASSWRYYERGNALRSSTSGYSADAAETCVLRLKHVFTAEFFETRAGWGVNDPSPVFIVGLPRSGSTLIEQILASHSLVEGTQELTEIGRYVSDLCGADPVCGLPIDPRAMHRLSAREARALGERFLSETRVYRREGRPFFIDKMPNNFWHVGLIHLILPSAIIIDVRREPMACCFSNLKQLFGTTNQEFTYGIDDIARYYRAYLDLMRHWDAVLPGRVLRLHYEDVVEDLECSVDRMLNHCGLPFERACLVFHETRRSVRTPSSEQVRQPIDRQALDQWRNYAPWLAPLRDRLGDALTDYRS
ncbi:tetratricopeptide repeat-containing sulfotransferase family protein [Novosphingobium album (ex Hu et al. 2023)]|uniref:Sulfotransferase n=1 Tax=Novosphingobium album (ex Hu et al. 2023) TaxID=2930093 RepID=A0ABT0AWH6_9SPHN|nr:tetratricopeptide repeat-containing sulfotransferase family protein [Novosphingobium album (ex Hu et al. 2023)]MCJ2177187.1 sulfotransferase [Novosphingobium album (ex Hu et al. 2023)]